MGKKVEVEILNSNFLRALFFHGGNRNKNHVYLVPGFLVTGEILLKTDFGKSAGMLACLENSTFFWTHIHNCLFCNKSKIFLQASFTSLSCFSVVTLLLLEFSHTANFSKMGLRSRAYTHPTKHSPHTVLLGAVPRPP